jgi:REP element-mobilizing transposase RayT
MARPWRIRYAGAKYHVTVRGNGRRTVFLDGADYERFMDHLVEALEQDRVTLYAYVLMPNHYHLLIETSRGNVQRFMQRLNTAYSMYFRFKHARPGHCFQGRYGAKVVSGDEYLVRLTRYIHLNPIKIKRMKNWSEAERREYLEGYRWSSYEGYVSEEGALEYVDYHWLKLMGCATMSGNRRAYRRYIAGMIEGRDEELFRANDASRYAIGDERFQEQVAEDLKTVRVERAVRGDIVWPVGRSRTPLEIELAVKRALGLDETDLSAHGRRAGIGKKVAVELCCRFCDLSQREIGRHFGYRGNGSVGKQRRALKELTASDKTLAA